MKLQHKKTRKLSTKARIILSILGAVIIGAAGYTAFAYQKDLWPFAQPEESVKADESGVNYNPPTEKEIEDSQDGKKNSLNQEPKTDEPKSTSKSAVSVGIAFAGFDEKGTSIDVRAFTPDAIEGDATCTAILTKGNVTVKESSKGFIDYSSTQCEPILISKDRLSSGEWSLTVEYSSSKHTGTSPATKVTI